VKNNQRLPALRDAVNKLGGIVEFSKALDVTHQAVYYWFAKGWVPLERAVLIERLTGVDRNFLVKPSVAEALQAAAVNDIL
tara:strand:- start:589 stop:831 length:243 start_codon:yes stop_codon:yes gene_type:complete